MPSPSAFQSALSRLDATEPRAISGVVTAARGLRVLVRDLPLATGALVRIEGRAGDQSSNQGKSDHGIRGEIVGFDGRDAIVMLLEESNAISPGMRVVGERNDASVVVGNALIGRVVNALGEPIDGLGPLRASGSRPLNPAPMPALDRARITEPLTTGIRAIDGMLTLARGQRIGVFSGPGVGKSTLLASIARRSSADVNVIALVGERGREVPDFIESALGADGMARSVVVVATGDESPLLRVRAALAAATIAESFRDDGRDVLLMMDSVTRLAQAQRQIGLTAGEPPATRGYTPSVFALMPRLLERAGRARGAGSITGLYTVLVEGDDLDEPVSDTVRGVLDGHIILSRAFAVRGHFPAIDVLASVSRLADDVCDEAHCVARRRMRELLAAYADAEELIQIGAYVPGRGNHLCDEAIARRPLMDGFLRQDLAQESSFAETCRDLITALTQPVESQPASGANASARTA